MLESPFAMKEKPEEHSILPTPTESSGVPELQDNPNRIVVFGSRLSGAEFFTNDFLKLLKENGIENPSVVLMRDGALIDQAFYGQQIQNDKPSIPKGVVIFPEMRQYEGKSQMFIATYCDKDIVDGQTPFEKIKNLCEKHSVPYIKMTNYDSIELSIRERIREIIGPKSE